MSYEAIVGEVVVFSIMIVLFYLGYRAQKEHQEKRKEEGEPIINKRDLKILGIGLFVLFLFGIISIVLIG